jgi:hypothetical protein
VIRTYRETQLADGTRVVESTGPIIGTWLKGRTAVAMLFFLGTVICLFEAQWVAAGTALLVGMIVLLPRPKWARLQ